MEIGNKRLIFSTAFQRKYSVNSVADKFLKGRDGFGNWKFIFSADFQREYFVILIASKFLKKRGGEDGGGS